MKKFHLPSIDKSVETVILANGKFPEHNIPLSILDNCINLISCDGASNELINRGIIPNAIVGDCDSLSYENKVKFASITHQISDQETNDLTKAVKYCISLNLKEITILGATGKREDHTLGNISLLAEYMQIASVQMVTDYGVFVAIEEDSNFESYQGQQVSIFSLDQKPLSVNGLVYPIYNKVFNRWWQATLNEAKNSEFIVRTKGATIVYREFTKK